MASIYIIHCITSGKKYVGQTRGSVRRRVNIHFSKRTIKNNRSPRLYSAMEKYGRENFIWGVAEECDDSLADEREIALIEQYGTYSHGYNSTIGGSTFKKHSAATRAKMSATWKAKGTSNRKGKKNSEESNRKRRETFAKRKSLGLPVGRPKSKTHSATRGDSRGLVHECPSVRRDNPDLVLPCEARRLAYTPT